MDQLGAAAGSPLAKIALFEQKDAIATACAVDGHADPGSGARARMPENTLPAFEYAIQQGVDALEMDLAVTKDGVLVISHDPILDFPICTGPRNGMVIYQLTLSEIREWDCGTLQNPYFPL